ncbi:MAG: 50S ribosomal protein L17 [Chloroflexi bacterium]|nr:50S ribosomal protein L17 [Chloroflexota bacterium]
MRHKLGHRKLGRATAPRLALLRNQATDLFRYEKIRTTEPKAKELRQMAEHLITLAKRGDLHARRQILAQLYDVQVANKLVDELAQRFADRPGGYVRLVHLGPRRGDSAPMAQVELVF